MTGNAKSIQVHMLGPFQIVVDGVPVKAAAWRSKKAQMLLKYLVAHRGKPIHRDVLLDLLWPEEDPETAIGRLYTTLHLLRRAVQPDLPRYGDSAIVRSGGGRYWCDGGAEIWVDSEAFVDLYDRAVAAEAEESDAAWPLWQECIALYKGNFLEEDPYEEWAVLPREALLDKFVDASLRAAKLQYELTGDPEPSAQLCRTALAHDRFREELYQALITYLLAADRSGEAAMQYRQLRTMLRDEFALEPSDTTQDLLRQSGIDPMRGLTGKATRASKLIERLPVAEVPPLEPEAGGRGPFIVDGNTFQSLVAWNERLSARYLTSFSVLTVHGTAMPAGVGNELFQSLSRQLRSSDVLARDERGVYILLPYMERLGARVVVRRLRSVAAELGWAHVDVGVRVVIGRDLALVGNG